MEYIGPGHWTFAIVFTLAFMVGIVFAYREDIKKSPWFFKGTSKFAMIVVGSVFALLILKMLHRAMF
ncbi:MAG: hypothetical protein ACI9FU_001966 [Granulosicoccus sp.]|jgi:hypothetical protein